MIKTLKPYGSIAKRYYQKKFSFRDKYYLIDIFGNRYVIDEETWKGLKND